MASQKPTTFESQNSPAQQRTCECGRDYTPRNSRQVTCLRDECRKERSRKKRRALRAADPEKYSEYQRTRRAADPEKYRQYGRTYKAKNAAKVRARQRAYYAADPEKFRNYQRSWRAKDPAKAKADARAYRARNRAKFRAYGRADYSKHREKRKAQTRRWYARRRKLELLGLQVVQGKMAPTSRTKRDPGRKPEQENNKRYWSIGEQVEKLIPDNQKQDKLAIMTARHSVSNKTRLSYDVVAQYHKRFRHTRY
jgi:hypothetical protein